MTLTYDQLTLFEKVLYHDAFDGQGQGDGGGTVDRLNTVDIDLDHTNDEPGDRPQSAHLKTDAEAFDGQDQDDGGLIPIGYAEIECFCGAGWFYCIDGLHYNPLFYHPAPLIDERDLASNDVEASNEIAETLDNSLPDFSKSCIEGGDRPSSEPAYSFGSSHFPVMDETDLGDRPQSAHQKNDDELFGGQNQDKPLRKKDKRSGQKAMPPNYGQYWYEHSYKTIKGKTYGPYLVQRWRDENGKKRSRYLGKAPKGSTAPGQPA